MVGTQVELEPRSSRSRRSAPRHCMVVLARYPYAETRVQRQAEALVAAGYDVDVICRRHDDEPARDREGGVEIHRLPVGYHKGSLVRQLADYLHFFVLAMVRLTRLHLRHRYRSVQVHNLPDFLVFCALVPKLLGAKVILDLHDLMPEFYEGRFESGRGALPLRLIRWQERAACRFADHVVTVSDHWRKELIGRGVPARKSSVVMNVADPKVFRRQPAATAARRDETAFLLVYHGTVTRRYGLDLAIEAVAQVRDEIPGIKLTVIGQGDALPELRALRDDLGLTEHVELGIDYLPLDELPGVLASADAGIVPYRDDVFTDGIVPTKLMEYAALGMPCIAARTTAIEAYFGGANVELFDPGDAEGLAGCIRALWRDPGRRAELAARSRTFTDRYDWTRVGAEYVALVEGLPAR